MAKFKKYIIKPSLKQKTNKEKERGRKWKILKLSLKIGGALFLLLLASIFALFLYFIQDLPSPEKIKERRVIESTKIYDRTGQYLLYEVHGEEKRTVVPLSEISDYIKWATITAEDDDFYKHPGVDFKSILRAGLADLRGLDYQQGASTITQQFIKNSILNREKMITRKLKEIILSLELERRFSKDQILEMYLNQIPYGSNAYGVEAAAQTFFGKSAQDLDLAESAILASLPKAPTRLSPFGSHLDELNARHNFILQRMRDLGYINDSELKQAQEEKIEYKPGQEGIIAPHFVMFVKEQMAEKFGEDFIEQEGLKVFTTLDMEKQKIAEEAVRDGGERNRSYKAYNAALLALDPQKGDILALVGSLDYFGKLEPQVCTPGKDCKFEPNVNLVLRERQPGSAFKPFAYAKAFEKGYTPDTLFFDLRTNFGPPGPNQPDYIPQNYDLKERGPVTMKFALANSLNIPAVKTLYLAGVNETIDLAERLGITTLKDRGRFGLALVLGGGEVKLIDMVGAYVVFANEGIFYKPHGILRIEDKQGKVLEDLSHPEGKKVLDEDLARQINQILSDNNLRSATFGSRNYLTLGKRPAAAKTGTTQEFRDAWTIGYTPSLAAGVWVGNNDNSKMHLAPGAKVAAPIWHQFMQKALKGAPLEEFTPPPKKEYNKMVLHGKYNEKVVRLCKIDHKLATDKVPAEETYEKKFKEIHSILYFVNKDDPQGDPPLNPQDDPQYERWEREVQKWVKKQGISLEAIPTETCEKYYTDEKRPKVHFVELEDGHNFQDGEIEAKTKIEAEREVKLVEFYLNDDYIGRARKEEDGIWKLQAKSYEPSSVYTLKARAFDDVGAVGQAEVKIYLRNNEVISLVKPGKNEILGLAQFPYSLEAIGIYPAGIQKISFFYKNPDQDGDYLIGSVSAPAGDTNRYQLVWKTQPGPRRESSDQSHRKLKIFARLFAKQGAVIQSQARDIELNYEEE